MQYAYMLYISMYVCWQNIQKNYEPNNLLSVHTVVYFGANFGLAYSTKSSIKTGHAPANIYVINA